MFLIRSRAAGILRVLAVLASGALAAPGAHGESVRTVSADVRGATFDVAPSPARFDSVSIEGRLYARVTVAGAYMAEPPGKPALPALLVPFGVPDGLSPRVRVVDEEWATRAAPPPLPVVDQRYVADDPAKGPESEYRWNPDPLVYAGAAVYPAEPVGLAGGTPIGEMWADAARIRPVRWDPRAGSYRVLVRMTLRVDFVPATERERAARPAFRPAAEATVWKRIQQTTLQNFDAARAFPRRPSRAPAPARAPARIGQGNPEFKVSVAASGWSSVGYDALAAEGFPAGVSIANVGVWERGWDSAGDIATATPVPVVPRDATSDGIFNSGDAITFYARNLRDRFGAGSLENRYSYDNVYWLTWTSSPAATTDSIPGVIPAPTPETPTSYLDTIHLEQNLHLMAAPSSVVGSPSESVEDIFWTTGTAPDQFDTLIPFASPETSRPLRIRARYQGLNQSTHRLNIFYQHGSATDTLALAAMSFNQDVYILDTGFAIPGSHIASGASHYQHTGDRSTGGPFFQGSADWLDWIEVTYARQYVASGNQLTFTTDTASTVAELHVTGFTQPGVRVYDVTDPAAPLRVTGVVEAGGGGAFDITFRADASGGPRRFTAFVPGTEAAIAPAAIVADIPSSLTLPTPATTQTRALFIGPRSFLTPLNRLADYRRSQGYVVEVAAIDDVYDEFSGGIKSAAAIRRYAAYANRHWTPRPTFLVLAGDASLDYRKDVLQSAVDWVPTYLSFEVIAGPQGPELVAHDSYYSLDLDSLSAADPSNGSLPFIPSVFTGRIPASNPAELDAYVSKVIQYEQFQPTDAWRGRQLLVSDDQYSTSIFFNQNYCLQTVEGLFRAGSQAMADTTLASAPGQDIQTTFFDLKTYSDPVPTFTDPFGNSCRSLTAVKNAFAAPGGCYDQLIAQAAQGGLVLNVEAHANRYLIAHEDVFCVPSFYCSSPFTTDRIANVGKPFLFMVWGCHSNQFPDGPQYGIPTIDSTDAIGEVWVLRPGGGSIGSLGSSGFELLQTNAAYNGFVAQTLYTQPPAPVIPGQPRLARWILGEIIGKAAILNALTGSFTQRVMNRTIHLLGDPMVHMDALPPRVWQVEVDGVPVTEGSALATDSPTDSLDLVARVRDEVTIRTTDLAERLLPSGTIVPLPASTFTVTAGDTGRANTLAGRVRPRASNYDVLVRATDLNGRQRLFALQVRVAVRYTADGKDILNGEFVGGTAVLRAEITTPVPVAADSLELWVDGAPIVVTKTQNDGSGRRWTLESLPESHGPGTHELRIAVGGRSVEFDAVTFRVDAAFRILHVAVVSPSIPTTGCEGSVFQYELTAPASRVRLRVLTIAGRRVASLTWPGNTGINVQCWDGRDSEGHEVARGVYLYRLTATDGSGKSSQFDGRMIRPR